MYTFILTTIIVFIIIKLILKEDIWKFIWVNFIINAIVYTILGTYFIINNDNFKFKKQDDYKLKPELSVIFTDSDSVFIHSYVKYRYTIKEKRNELILHDDISDFDAGELRNNNIYFTLLAKGDTISKIESFKEYRDLNTNWFPNDFIFWEKKIYLVYLPNEKATYELITNLNKYFYGTKHQIEFITDFPDEGENLLAKNNTDEK